MIVIVPFHPAIPLIETLAGSLKTHGQCEGHTLIVMAQRTEEEGASEFLRKTGKLFTEASVKLVDAMDHGGLVGVSNSLFKAAMHLFRERGGLKVGPEFPPMLYMDPTWHPSKRAWLDAIQAEFYAKGTPRILCRWKANDKGENESKGPVVFSKEYALETALLPHIPATTHWRHYLRYEMNNVATVSETISAGKKGVVKLYRPATFLNKT